MPRLPAGLAEHSPIVNIQVPLKYSRQTRFTLFIVQNFQHWAGYPNEQREQIPPFVGILCTQEVV
jgi:hypothetical protein